MFNFAIEFMGANLTNPIMGFVKKDKTIDLSKIDNTKKADDFWIKSEKICVDICEKIITDGFENNLLNNIIDLIKKSNDEISNLKQN